jgi:hypothetical protein
MTVTMAGKLMQPTTWGLTRRLLEPGLQVADASLP